MREPRVFRKYGKYEKNTVQTIRNLNEKPDSSSSSLNVQAFPVKTDSVRNSNSPWKDNDHDRGGLENGLSYAIMMIYGVRIQCANREKLCFADELGVL